MKSFVIAFGLLTRIPVTSFPQADDACYGRAVLWFPLVGIVIGAILFCVAYFLRPASDLVTAVLIVGIWIYVTGGLHIDGLADSADAWIGGMGDKQRTLAIMKDPTAGPGAVTAVVLNILLKVAAVFALIETEQWMVIALSPVAARVLCVLLYATTAYAKTEGMGVLMVAQMPQRPALALVALALGAVALTGAIMLPALLAAVIACLTAFYLLRYRMLKRIGGLTGDTSGELIEVTESIWLAAAALALAM